MPPFFDIVPIDDKGGELENISTSPEEYPYEGIKWDQISRPVAS